MILFSRHISLKFPLLYFSLIFISEYFFCFLQKEKFFDGLSFFLNKTCARVLYFFSVRLQKRERERNKRDIK